MKKLLAVGLLAVGLLWGVSAFAQLSQTDSVDVLFDVDPYLMFDITDGHDPVNLGTIDTPDTYTAVGYCDYTVTTNVAEWDLEFTSVSIVSDASNHPTKDVTDVIETQHPSNPGWAILSTAPFDYIIQQARSASTAIPTASGGDGKLEWRARLISADFNYFPHGNTYRVQCIVTCSEHL